MKTARYHDDWFDTHLNWQSDAIDRTEGDGQHHSSILFCIQANESCWNIALQWSLWHGNIFSNIKSSGLPAIDHLIEMNRWFCCFLDTVTTWSQFTIQLEWQSSHNTFDSKYFQKQETEMFNRQHYLNIQRICQSQFTADWVKKC